MKRIALLLVVLSCATLAAQEADKRVYVQTGTLPAKDARTVRGPAITKQADGRIAISSYDGKVQAFPTMPRGGATVDRDGNLYVRRVMVVRKWFTNQECADAVKDINSYRQPKAAFMQITKRLLPKAEWQGPLDFVWVRSGRVDASRDWGLIADTNNGRIVKCRLVYGDSNSSVIE